MSDTRVFGNLFFKVLAFKRVDVLLTRSKCSNRSVFLKKNVRRGEWNLQERRIKQRLNWFRGSSHGSRQPNFSNGWNAINLQARRENIYRPCDHSSPSYRRRSAPSSSRRKPCLSIPSRTRKKYLDERCADGGLQKYVSLSFIFHHSVVGL